MFLSRDQTERCYTLSMRTPAKQAARGKGSRRSKPVQGAIHRQPAIEHHVTAYEVARSAGVIGVIRGARKDLSTNRTLLNGFGGS